jgi:predicted XRE-type DNA-binding protein
MLVAAAAVNHRDADAAGRPGWAAGSHKLWRLPPRLCCARQSQLRDIIYGMADEPDDPDDLDSPDESLPVLPGFREMALRRASGERSRLLAELAARRQASGLSQTEIAARMGTSQSAVARLEAGVNDVRLSTLQRYAAAVGSHLSLRVQAENVGEKE